MSDEIKTEAANAPEKEKVPYYKQVADMLIDKIEHGTAPWQKSWESGKDYYPYNPTTEKHYKGINAIVLMSAGRDDPRWLTYNQAKAAEAHVRQGEKGMPIQYWEFEEKVPKLDKEGKPVLDEKGQEVKETVKLDQPRVIWSTVFNATQIDGLPPLEPKAKAWNEIEAAEKVIAETGAKITHKAQDRAFYSPASDEITLPLKKQFPSEIAYYQTAAHELGHWTGHESRLNRDMNAKYGTPEYAREELRAEITSVMTGAAIGIGSTPREENAAYVKSWVEVLKNDPKELYRAAADAEKAAQYITKSLNLEQGKTAAKEAEKAPAPAQTLQNAVESLKQSLEKSAAAMKSGDLSKVAENFALISKAAALSKSSGRETRQEIGKAMDSFAKDLKQSKTLSTPTPKMLTEINNQLRHIDKHFDQGLSR